MSVKFRQRTLLFQIRDKRDRGWQLLRRQWLDDQDVTQESLAYAPNQPLAEAYEGYVQEADNIADRLRREADRVAGGSSSACSGRNTPIQAGRVCQKQGNVGTAATGT